MPEGNLLQRSNLCLLWLPILAILLSPTSGSSRQEGVVPSQEEVQAGFLSDKFGREDVLALAHHPGLVGERAVQIKLYRSFNHEDAAISSAVLSLCFKIDQLATTAPMVERRCNSSFIGQKLDPQLALLKLLLEDSRPLADLRMIGLISRGLHSEEPLLRELVTNILARYPHLAETPAIAEAVGSADQDLPGYEKFVERVNPILTAPGSDGKACVDCHKSRPILFLPTPRGDAGEEDLLPQRYQSVLRVIDLTDPEASLILNKPRNPAPETPRSPSGPGLHTGGTRFEKGSSTYQTLLEWIRSGASGGQ